jgi:chromosome condensin MukBEF complex kleisin-like MukF subunit
MKTTMTQTKSKGYNGHRSWNAWNVALWIGNDEGIYRFAQDCIIRSKNRLGIATRLFLLDFKGMRTPDGAI